MNSGKHFSAECWLLAEWNYRAREGVLVVAADEPFSWATPAMLDGSKWTTLNRNWFQDENHLPHHGDQSARCACSWPPCRNRIGVAFVRGYQKTQETGYGKNDHIFPEGLGKVYA